MAGLVESGWFFKLVIARVGECGLGEVGWRMDGDYDVFGGGMGG